MRNAQLKPGYNVQIGVEGEYIVSADVFHMKYNQETDTYTCHNEQTLRVTATAKKKIVTGHEAEVTIYECAECSGCPCKEKCTRSKGNKKK